MRGRRAGGCAPLSDAEGAVEPLRTGQIQRRTGVVFEYQAHPTHPGRSRPFVLGGGFGWLTRSSSGNERAFECKPSPGHYCLVQSVTVAGEELNVEIFEMRLVVRGELDATTIAVLDRALASLAGPLLLDLTGVRFIDSKALAVLVRAMQPKPCHAGRRM